jgi:hypothetical protein
VGFENEVLVRSVGRNLGGCGKGGAGHSAVEDVVLQEGGGHAWVSGEGHAGGGGDDFGEGAVGGGENGDLGGAGEGGRELGLGGEETLVFISFGLVRERMWKRNYHLVC